MANVSFNPYAEADYEVAFDWYRGRGATVAARFAAAFDRAIGMLTTFPEIGAPCDDRCRYWSLRKFPYGIVYYLDGTDVRVVAVTHDGQLPGYWADRT
jgi:toxin ParE1/3/4